MRVQEQDTEDEDSTYLYLLEAEVPGGGSATEPDLTPQEEALEEIIENIPDDTGNVDSQPVGVYDHTLHVVITAPAFVIDDDGTGEKIVTLDGRQYTETEMSILYLF